MRVDSITALGHQICSGKMILFGLQIAGKFVCVQDALYNVTSRLRDNLFPGRVSNGAGTRSSSAMIPEMSPYGIARDPSSIGSYTSMGISNNLNRHSAVTSSTDHFTHYHNYDHSLSQVKF